MSSSETDSDVSCPSDDSNYNFISQYMIEDAEIQVENRHELRASDDEGSSGLAYADEPLADELLLHVSTQAFYYSLANSPVGSGQFLYTTQYMSQFKRNIIDSLNYTRSRIV